MVFHLFLPFLLDRYQVLFTSSDASCGREICTKHQCRIHMRCSHSHRAREGRASLFAHEYFPHLYLRLHRSVFGWRRELQILLCCTPDSGGWERASFHDSTDCDCLYVLLCALAGLGVCTVLVCKSFAVGQGLAKGLNCPFLLNMCVRSELLSLLTTDLSNH